MDDDLRTPPAEPPAKRQRTLACQRCRSRKQKCEDTRPCSNCVKGNEQCVSTQPAPRMHVESDYVRNLEERVAELESRDPQQTLHLGSFTTTTAEGHNNSTSPNDNQEAQTIRPPASSSPQASRSSAQRRPSALSGASPRNILTAGRDEETGLDHLVFGLITSPSITRQDLHHSGSQASPATQLSGGNEKFYAAHSLVAQLPLDVEESLLEAYRERAQAQYPFFDWETFLQWASEWRVCLPGALKEQAWQGFFVNMVYATALLLLRRSHAGLSDATSFYTSAISLLPSVFEQPNQVLHIQAYLLLAMHALHQSSTERIITLASTTMRQCVQQQLHLSESEPLPLDVELRRLIQIRRRCFWCAYLLDRLVMSSFDLPPSIPDSMISVRPFANIEDCDFHHAAASTPADRELDDVPTYTSMSPALHILYCRRIQSEISAITLRWDYTLHYENSPEWRIRILAELEDYKSRVQKFSDPKSKGYTSQRWLAMIYHYTLLQLYRPTKSNVAGPAGDWSVQASSQACLMFRRTQIDRQIAHPWLALLVQFQSGITLLYCFWATPPEDRTDNYDSLDVSDALRACSNVLAIMADRWAKAECLRDVFELLAREIPLVDRPHKPPVRLSDKASDAIRGRMREMRSLVVHRPVLRMIEEMISENFPRARQSQLSSVAEISHSTSHPVPQTSVASMASVALNFQLPFSMQQPYYHANSGVVLNDIDVDGLLSFPGIFDFDSWS
ncbi:hypothetical protein FB567DRAFT_561937 [Paraphoma chrysanthemicola]|uniref:Zn(2)-C6 fungal-type domain-containing protein n=1 Tax=Paraphoma chrysanthemicola TaxID=798071 RepID=A0A8K0R0W5_9PLEO|nr:hypothetical protein FB567DRAFT_561937 [Paraphoma chrysanthemicola]